MQRINAKTIDVALIYSPKIIYQRGENTRGEFQKIFAVSKQFGAQVKEKYSFFLWTYIVYNQTLSRPAWKTCSILLQPQAVMSLAASLLPVGQSNCRQLLLGEGVHWCACALSTRATCRRKKRGEGSDGLANLAFLKQNHNLPDGFQKSQEALKNGQHLHILARRP